MKEKRLPRTFEELFLQFGLGDLDLDRLVHLLGMAALVICVVLDCGREQGVDEGCLSQTRFTSNLRTWSVYTRVRGQLGCV